MNDLEILKAVRELLADPIRWTRGRYARPDQSREGCAIEDGTCWCLNGAHAKVTGETSFNGWSPIGATHPMDRLLEGCIPAEYYGSSASFNDKSSHEEVLAALDCAIARAIQRAGHIDHTGAARDGQ